MGYITLVDFLEIYGVTTSDGRGYRYSGQYSGAFSHDSHKHMSPLFRLFYHKSVCFVYSHWGL